MKTSSALTELTWVKITLIVVAVAFLEPLALVLSQALAKGLIAYWSALVEPDMCVALRLTLLAVAIAVPANIGFGICAAWAIAKFEFKGKQLLSTLIDLPFAVSPVIARLIYVLS